MPYYSCSECGLTVQSVEGRFTARTCPRCSGPLTGSTRPHAPEGRPAAVSRHFAAEPRAAPAARRALRTPPVELDPAEYHVAALLTTELIANAIEHGGIGPGGRVRLEIALDEDRLLVAVGDAGPGFVPAARAPDAPLDSHWGLHLVDELADRWGVTAEPESTVWFELDRSRCADQRPAADPQPVRAGVNV
jgi:anti-sigma regulatory factor (Ser/Thr protein kinase)